ncbi:MAG: histidine triad nucleotide-binding protein [Nitrospinota bacterium]|nr:histidine triad nucleotide-binding protein [Nitrospinota bacterium]
MENCLFCKIGEGEIPSEIVYEAEKVFAIKDINPVAPIHHLIIPRKHFSTILEIEDTDHELIGSIHGVANHIVQENDLEQAGFRLVLNCGAGAGQTVFHIHFHFLAGRQMKWPPG